MTSTMNKENRKGFTFLFKRKNWWCICHNSNIHLEYADCSPKPLMLTILSCVDSHCRVCLVTAEVFISLFYTAH